MKGRVFTRSKNVWQQDQALADVVQKSGIPAEYLGIKMNDKAYIIYEAVRIYKNPLASIERIVICRNGIELNQGIKIAMKELDTFENNLNIQPGANEYVFTRKK